MLLLCLGLIVFGITVYAIIKRYNTIMTLMLSGAVLFALAFAFDANYFLPKGFSSTGSKFIDIFEVIKAIAASRAGGLGLIIMAAGGFAKYMNHIGAADTFVTIAAKPLHIIKNPYILVAMAYVFGQIMNIFIPSAAGLGMLMLVTLYPLLRKLNVSAPAAASALAATACLDLGPASGNSNAAADLSGMSPMEYFVSYQMPVSVITIVAIAVLFFITAKYFDKKDKENGVTIDSSAGLMSAGDKEIKQMPAVYALLPVLPLALLLIFSKYVISTIKMNVITAMFISLFIGLAFEIIRTRDSKTALKDTSAFFAGMGDMLKSVVMLIVAAEFFASGLQAIGFAHYMLGFADNLGFGVSATTVVLTSIIAVMAFVSGSGNAAFLSFANLAPGVAGSMGVPAVHMVLPMQLAAGMFRSMSPVAGVVIAISGATGVDPVAIVKRTIIPMLGGALVTFILSQTIL